MKKFAIALISLLMALPVFADQAKYQFQVKIHNAFNQAALAGSDVVKMEGVVTNVNVISGQQEIKGIEVGEKIGDGMIGLFYGAQSYKGTIDFQISDYKGAYPGTCTIKFDSQGSNYYLQTCDVGGLTIAVYSSSGLEQVGNNMIQTQHFVFTRAY